MHKKYAQEGIKKVVHPLEGHTTFHTPANMFSIHPKP